MRSDQITRVHVVGAERRIGAFDRRITRGFYSKPPIERGADTSPGMMWRHEAARHRTKLTLDEVLKENRRLETDLSGLKM